MQRYHARNLRLGRVSEPHRPYLITTVTLHRRPLFADWRVGRMLVAELRAATLQGYVDTLAWVIMPDHLHWLMEPVAAPLDALMRRVKSRSAHAINRYLGLRGALWQAGFHDHAVRVEEDIRGLARYIVANPLRAGLVETIGDYPLWDVRWL